MTQQARGLRIHSGCGRSEESVALSRSTGHITRILERSSASIIRGLCLAASVPVSGEGLVHRIVEIDKTADVSSPVNMAVLGLGLKWSLV